MGGIRPRTTYVLKLRNKRCPKCRKPLAPNRKRCHRCHAVQPKIR